MRIGDVDELKIQGVHVNHQTPSANKLNTGWSDAERGGVVKVTDKDEKWRQ